MSTASHYAGADAAGFLRCDRPVVARRQMEMSIGLVVVLLVATLTAAIAVPLMNGNTQDRAAAVARAEATVGPLAVIRAPVRIIPIFNEQAADQRRPAPRG